MSGGASCRAWACCCSSWANRFRIAAFSALQPFSPRVAFAVLVQDPLEGAVARFYGAHQTDTMKRSVAIAKFFRAQQRNAFSDEHLQQ